MDSVKLSLIVLFALLVLGVILAVLWKLVRRFWQVDGGRYQAASQEFRPPIPVVVGRDGVGVPAWGYSTRTLVLGHEPRVGSDVASQQQLVSETILLLQGTLDKATSSDEQKSEVVSQAQTLLLEIRKPVKHNRENGSQLIIGVDARPHVVAGYCVSLRERRLQYYIVKKEDFPWSLHDPDNSSEFEMKNLIFAVTLWKDEILKLKGSKISIYTDNHAVGKGWREDDKYGQRAFKALSHYQNEGVSLNWSTMVANRYRSLETFARYVQPADDLSRWKVSKALEFLTKIHGIQQENVLGTHVQSYSPPKNVSSKTSTGQATKKPHYKHTKRYQEVIRIVRETIDSIDAQDCSVPSCDCAVSLTSSLK